MLKILYFLILAVFINSRDITKETKHNPRAYRVESLDTIKQKIAEHNCIVVFHADWCGHW